MNDVNYTMQHTFLQRCQRLIVNSGATAATGTVSLLIDSQLSYCLCGSRGA